MVVEVVVCPTLAVVQATKEVPHLHPLTEMDRVGKGSPVGHRDAVDRGDGAMLVQVRLEVLAAFVPEPLANCSPRDLLLEKAG